MKSLGMNASMGSDMEKSNCAVAPTEDDCENRENEVNSGVSLEAEEKKLLSEFIERRLQKLSERKSALENNSNLNEKWTEQKALLPKLDASVRKIPAFIKRLKIMAENQRSTIEKELVSLNLSRYISEVCSALVEAKIKASDIPTALHYCTLLHHRYADFSELLMEAFGKSLRNVNSPKFKIDLRLFTEIILCGFFVDHLEKALNIIYDVFNSLLSSDTHFIHVSSVIYFCRYSGEELLNLIPSKYAVLAEKYSETIPKFTFIASDIQSKVKKLFCDYYESIANFIAREHLELKRMEDTNKRILQTKGEISNDKKEKFESKKAAFNKLFQSAETLCDYLNECPIQLLNEETDNKDSEELSMGDSLAHRSNDDTNISDGLWENDETRNFYEYIPDLKALIPGMQFKESDKNVGQCSFDPDDELSNAVDIESVEKEIEDASNSSSSTADTDSSSSSDGGINERDGAESGTDANKEENDTANEPDTLDTNEDLSLSANKLIMNGFINSLSSCVSRELIDRAAQDFCMNMNTKFNRKKLAKALFQVPKTRTDLIPFYARLVAILNPCMPDIVVELTRLLKADFRYHLKKKDQVNLESKLKSIRFIGELVKFKLFSKSDALQMFKSLLADFKHHNIEMCCCLLESCGRFLYRMPESHQRTKVYLEILMRKKNSLSMDERYVTMIENAFYFCNPPEGKSIVVEEYTITQKYLLKLLTKDLTKFTVDKVLRHIRKMNWEDEEFFDFALSCFSSPHIVRFNCIQSLANVLSGFVQYQPMFVTMVVDAVLENLRCSLEVYDPRACQRMLCLIHYLGELYNFVLVDDSVIFKTLYTIISCGVYVSGASTSVDPQVSLIRIRLASVLLETVGPYIKSGKNKKKLDYFLLYFQAYWKGGANVPVEIKNIFMDTISNIRPKFRFANSLQEACDNLQAAEDELTSILPCAHLANEAKVTFNHRFSAVNGKLASIPEGSESNSTASENESGDYDAQLKTVGKENMGMSSHFVNACMLNSYEEMKSTESSSTVTAYEDDVVALFDAHIAEQYSQRSKEMPKVPSADIAIPVGAKHTTFDLNYQNIKDKADESSNVEFAIMLKKNSKMQLQRISVPVSSKLVTRLVARKEAALAEKKELKMRTLNFSEMQEQEELEEAMAESMSEQKLQVSNWNVKKHQRYNKGGNTALHYNK